MNYSYDNANLLTQITQGASTATYTYDNANRRASLTLPNGVVVAYSYDAVSRLTGLTYKKGALTLGDLTYAYDKAGRRIATGGSFARTGIPQALNTTTYDAANQQLTLGNKSATFDTNGNLAALTDPNGTTTYTWKTRNWCNQSAPGNEFQRNLAARGRTVARPFKAGAVLTSSARPSDGIEPLSYYASPGLRSRHEVCAS